MGKKFVFLEKLYHKNCQFILFYLLLRPGVLQSGQRIFFLPFLIWSSIQDLQNTWSHLYTFYCMIFNTGLTEHMNTTVYIFLYDIQYRTYRTHEHNCIHFLKWFSIQDLRNTWSQMYTFKKSRLLKDLSFLFSKSIHQNFVL